MKKMNNSIKKIAVVTTASLLAACAMVPMFTGMTSYAAVNNFDLVAPSTLPSGASITNVRAYKIFEGEYIEANNIFNVKAWANGVTNETLGLTATGAAAAAEELSAMDGTALDAVAKTAANALGSGTGVAGTYTNGKVEFANDLAVGYYLVLCDAQIDAAEGYKATSLGMLTVTGTASSVIGNGTAKVGLPTVQKKVYEDQEANAAGEAAAHETDKKWNDVADYDIGDAVPFKLYGTLPADLAKYDTYYYKFTDTLDVQFDKPTEMTIKVGTTTFAATKTNGDWVTPDDSGITVQDTDNGFTVEFANIKPHVTTVNGAETTVDTTAVVTVEYNAVLNNNAVVGKPGQNNKVDLTYSNNPNKSGSGESDDNTGTTPEDYVKVYTYAVQLDKDFFNAAGDALTPEEVTAGVYDEAEFSLKDANGNKLYFVESADGNFDYVLSKNGVGGATTALKLTNVSNNLVIRIKGLDEGTYTLTEEVVPSGFNVAPAQTIEITAGTVNDQTWNGTDADVTLESFSWKIGNKTIYQGMDETGTPITENNEEAGKFVTVDAIAKAIMENRKGTTLPGTGGIGTTIFYLGGGLMTAVGGIYLISKRRTKENE